MTDLEIAWRSSDLLGEGPVWDERTSQLLRVDAVAGQVRVLDLAEGSEQVHEVGSAVGCVALTEQTGRLLLGLAAGFGSLDLATGAVELLAKAEHEVPGMQLNDGACDPRGRFLAGSICQDASPGRGVLYRLERDVAEPVLTGIGVSNGFVWDEAGTTLLFVDSLLKRVDAFTYDLDAGTVSDRRTAFDVSGFEGIPDGMTIDAEGCLWVAFWRGGVVRRFDPAGAVLAEVRLPVQRTTSCCLGGTDLRTLFVTTATRSLRSAGTPEPLGGAVFAIEVDTPGLPTQRAAA